MSKTFSIRIKRDFDYLEVDSRLNELKNQIYKYLNQETLTKKEKKEIQEYKKEIESYHEKIKQIKDKKYMDDKK